MFQDQQTIAQILQQYSDRNKQQNIGNQQAFDNQVLSMQAPQQEMLKAPETQSSGSGLFSSLLKGAIGMATGGLSGGNLEKGGDTAPNEQIPQTLPDQQPSFESLLNNTNIGQAFNAFSGQQANGNGALQQIANVINGFNPTQQNGWQNTLYNKLGGKSWG